MTALGRDGRADQLARVHPVAEALPLRGRMQPTPSGPPSSASVAGVARVEEVARRRP